MISPQGVKGDNHLFKEELWGSHQQTWGGHLEKSASGWWRDQRTKKEEWEVKPPPPHPSSLSALQPLKRHWCCVKSNHKRETLGEHERNDAMKGWRRRGCRGLVLEGRACVWVGSFGGFFLHLSHLESLVSLVPCSLVHNSSAVTQQILVSKRDSEGKILHRCGLTLCRFSARFLLNPLPWVLFWYDFSNHDHVCISPSSGLRYALILHAWHTSWPYLSLLHVYP